MRDELGRELLATLVWSKEPWLLQIKAALGNLAPRSRSPPASLEGNVQAQWIERGPKTLSSGVPSIHSGVQASS